MTLAAALGLLQGGNLEAAERLCRKLLKRHPGDPQTQHLMGLVLLHCARPGDALDLLKKAAKRQPDNPDCHYNLAECRRALGKPDASFRAAVAALPGLAAAWNGLGLALREQGRLDEAVDSWRRALGHHPIKLSR